MASDRLRNAIDAWEEVLFPCEGGKDMLLSVLDAYNTPGRYYHTLLHLTEMTELLCEYRAQLQSFTSAIFACLWHDIIYDAQRTDNEEASITRWQNDAETMKILPVEKERVAELILATKKHQVTGTSPDMAIFLDADLAILGSSLQRYGEYLHAIRREYAHVPEADYRAGRVAVLNRFLGREKIFFNEAIRERFEASARKYIGYEIAVLSKPDTFQGTFEHNASGRLTWSVYEARVEMMDEVSQHLREKFGFANFSEPIWSPDSIIAECSNAATTLKWGWDVFSGFYFFAADAPGDALVQQLGEYFNAMLGEVKFNLYRTYPMFGVLS